MYVDTPVLIRATTSTWFCDRILFLDIDIDVFFNPLLFNDYTVDYFV